MIYPEKSKTVKMNENARRPVLVIGLGGTGHRVTANLKALVQKHWKQNDMERRVRFLVFDTAQESLNSQSASLEPGTEFIDIGQTPVANIKRNLSRQSAIQQRLGSVMSNLPPAVLRSGAKQLRPLGLLAFLWRYNEVEERLRDAIWSLAGREQGEGREGINVFIVNSLVGGTGSSTFLDVAHLTRDLFDELGTLADFCHVTGIGVLPRAFHGINGPNLIPNTVASLKELNHCMMRGGFSVRYPNGRSVSTAQPPFNIYYLIDGVDERGRTWDSHNDVCRMTAEAVFLQMGSQIGQKQENDFDNLDDILVQRTEEGDGTYNGSFGLAALTFSGPEVARACAARQAVQLIERGLLATLPDDERDLANDFIAAAGLEAERLIENLSRDDQELPLSVELPLPAWASRLSPQERPPQVIRYVRDYERARLSGDFKRWLNINEKQLTVVVTTELNAHLTRLAARQGLSAAQDFLTRLLTWLEDESARLNARQSERERRLTGLNEELAHQENIFLQAGEGHFLGRGRRVTQAQQTYLGLAERFYTLRWQTQTAAGSLVILEHLGRAVRDGLTACRETVARLQTAGRILSRAARNFEDDSMFAGVTTQSLADESLITKLFEEYAPPLSDTIASLFTGDASPLDWRDSPPELIRATLLDACLPPFQPIAALSVEKVLQLYNGGVSFDNYYNWLSAQAAPSWNLDRTRLSDGGAALQRLEILGVPDENDTLFRQRAKVLVSTGDPSRLVAFVAHVGAAHTAIQQWDGYLAAYKRAREGVPLHILPEFQSDDQRARQAFALGSLFGFIKNQGAYFYYHPADHLDQPHKLAQGLANALNAFSNQDSLVREIWDRIEQVVAKQGVESALRRLAAYYNAKPERYPADALILELKQLVRNYADELRQIHQFTAGSWMPTSPPPPDGKEQEVRDAA